MTDPEHDPQPRPVRGDATITLASPQDAATVILLRDAGDDLEVLLLRRPHAQKFMGGAWVFPGGKVDPKDGAGEPALRQAAVRELAEEAGVSLAPADLVLWARWVTPEREPVRFDARFYLGRLPAGATVRPDPREVVESAWLRPDEAIERAARGELRVMPPTLRNLELLRAYPRFAAVAAAAGVGEPWPIRPRLEMLDGRITIVLPGDPLHDDPVRRLPGPTRMVYRDNGFVSEDPP
jgi:8-oxo-dGTP pyrophosphatase MutT (NUDIX family)